MITGAIIAATAQSIAALKLAFYERKQFEAMLQTLSPEERAEAINRRIEKEREEYKQSIEDRRHRELCEAIGKRDSGSGSNLSFAKIFLLGSLLSHD